MASNLPPLTGDVSRDLPPLSGDLSKDLGGDEPTGLTGAVIRGRNAVGTGLGQVADMATLPLRTLWEKGPNPAAIGQAIMGAGREPSPVAKAVGPPLRDVMESAAMPWSKAAGIPGLLTRSAQSGALGAGQGYLEKGDVKDAGTRGALSAVVSPVGEGVMAGLGKLWRSVPGSAARITKEDVARGGAAIGEINPTLGEGGIETRKDLYRMAVEGRRRLGDAKEEIVQAIEQTTGGPKQTFMFPTMGPEQLTLREANAKMTKLGQQAFGIKPDYEKITQYRAMKQDFLSTLDAADPTGKSTALFEKAQEQWMKGVYLLSPFRMKALWPVRGGGEPNIPYLQGQLRAPRVAAELTEKLGQKDYNKLLEGFRATEGTDVIRNTGPMSARGLLAALGTGGAASAVGGPVGWLASMLPYALPNALSGYASPVPYALTPAKQAAGALLGKGTTDVVREATR